MLPVVASRRPPHDAGDEPANEDGRDKRGSRVFCAERGVQRPQVFHHVGLSANGYPTLREAKAYDAIGTSMTKPSASTSSVTVAVDEEQRKDAESGWTDGLRFVGGRD